MRGFTQIQAVLSVVMILLMGVVWGLPIAPALYVFDWLTSFGPSDRSWPDLFLIGFSASIAFLTWGMFLLLLSEHFISYPNASQGSNRCTTRFVDDDSLGDLWTTSSFNTSNTDARCSFLFANAYYRLIGM